jgi:ankyrin repeat protein
VRGLSLLHHAALGKNALVTQQALEAGADLHAVDGNGKRALDVAVMFGADDVEAVLAAAESRYADFTKVSPLVAETPAAPPVAPTPPPSRAREPPATLDALVAAVTGGDVALVRALLAASPALATAASPSGVTAAAMAARKGRTDALAELLRAGADARAVDVRGLSLLHHAALGKSPRAATLALEAGANVFAVDVNGKSASDVAAIFGAAEVADVLTAAEAVA